jgi:hypothetical protein
MFSAYLMMVRPAGEVPEHIRPFVDFDAKRRNIELLPSDKVAIVHVTTTQSYIIVPLGKGITLGSVMAQLSEIDTRLDGDSLATLERLLE